MQCNKFLLKMIHVSLHHVTNNFKAIIFICHFYIRSEIQFFLQHKKTNKLTCAPREDSDQPGHLPSPIRIFAVRMKKVSVQNYQKKHSKDSDQTECMFVQADLRLCWVHISCCGSIFSGQHVLIIPLQRDGVSSARKPGNQ